jgi:hypothetical protein
MKVDKMPEVLQAIEESGLSVEEAVKAVRFYRRAYKLLSGIYGTLRTKSMWVISLDERIEILNLLEGENDENTV